MPKLKTNRAANKRYGLTANGKVKRTSANSRHRLATKTKRQKRQNEVFFIKQGKSITKENSYE